VFTRIHMRFVVSGNNLKDTHVRRAIKLSVEKYCSASILMEQAGVEVTHEYVVEPVA
jgi:putative redox protein